MDKTLTAAPVVRQPLEVVGAPGKTDFVRIYIATELNKGEYRTTLRHEQGHVWGRHNARRPMELVRPDLWTIACEMEIARNIYDDRDIDQINAPRSRLAGGYLPDSIEGLPIDILLAEDIYEWLLENAPEPQKMRCVCVLCEPKPEDQENSPGETKSLPAQVIQAARDKLDAEEVLAASQVAAKNAYAAALNRPPSLTDAVDAALRVRIERERSFRRPSRRNADNTIMLRGAISTPRPPLVEIFVDRSGSFSPEKTAIAQKCLRDLLMRYGTTIRSDVWYFGNGRISGIDLPGGGNTPYHLISEHLTKTSPKLAIVITDSDPVGDGVSPTNRATAVICIAVGCARTCLAQRLGGKDVVLG